MNLNFASLEEWLGRGPLVLGRRRWIEEDSDARIYVRLETKTVAEGTFSCINIANFLGAVSGSLNDYTVDNAKIIDFIKRCIESDRFEMIYLESPEPAVWGDLLQLELEIDRFNAVATAEYRNFYILNKANHAKFRYKRYGLVM